MLTPEEQFTAIFDRLDRTNREVSAYYKLLTATGKLKFALVAEYRCSRGCLLAHIFRTPHGLAFYLPKYRLPPELNALSSSESGRKANTLDGNLKWKERCGLLSSAMNLGVNCDHIRLRVVENDEFEGVESDEVRRVIIEAGRRGTP